MRRLARDFAAAPTAAAYGRVGVCQQRTGTLIHWLINVLNAVTGNLDREGGAMFPEPFIDLTLALKLAGRGGPDGIGRFKQRVSGLPEMNGEVPVAGLADEILTPGEGQVRGLFVFAGNPVMSAPGGTRLDEALSDLEFMVSVDQYVNETNRHADVILPPVSALERDEVDVGASPGRDPQPHPVQPRGRSEARGRQGGLGDPQRSDQAPRPRNRDEGAGVLAQRPPGFARAGR